MLVLLVVLSASRGRKKEKLRQAIPVEVKRMMMIIMVGKSLCVYFSYIFFYLWPIFYPNRGRKKTIIILLEVLIT